MHAQPGGRRPPADRGAAVFPGPDAVVGTETEITVRDEQGRATRRRTHPLRWNGGGVRSGRR